MTTVVVAACSLLTAVAALVLLVRLRFASLDSCARLRPASAADDFPQRVLQLIRVSVDADLLARAGTGGLVDLEVRTREPRDPYRTAAELIDWIASKSAAADYHEISGLIKGVYQLGHVLRAPEAEVRFCMEPLIARIKAATVGGSPVARVECVRPGAILDPGTMAPLNYGARVTQPLGVLLYDADGKVLGKAKVLCG
jgi:hypothetical protein